MGDATREPRRFAMRTIIPLLIVTAVAGCSAQTPQQTAALNAKAQTRLAQLTAGKVPGKPETCLPSYRQNDMIVIDDYTIAFRDGTDRVWINKPKGGCNLLSAGPYALVTRSFGGMGLCSGDIAQVVDTLSRTTVGSCVMSEFVPYTTPGR
jgi:hypothetical protein